EDGIRDFHVTGVQTCALPICLQAGRRLGALDMPAGLLHQGRAAGGGAAAVRCRAAAGPVAGGFRRLRRIEEFDVLATRQAGRTRSEERRVGEEWRTRGAVWQE